MKMIKFLLGLTLACLFLQHCQEEKPTASIKAFLAESPSIKGKATYLASPFVTAGNRVYMVGHQDGSFPEIGWHIKGEMGGIWNHPIKLMDGFEVDLIWEEEKVRLDQAQSFTNYPMANQHVFQIESQQLEVERWQFVPDDQEGILIQFIIKNEGATTQQFTFRFTGNSDLRPTWLSERLQQEDYPDIASFDKKRQAWTVRDSLNAWHLIFGSTTQPDHYDHFPSDYAGTGIAGSLDYTISLNDNETKILSFAIAGSYQSEAHATVAYEAILEQYPQLVQEKRDRYRALAEKSKLTIPDKNIEQTFEWLKYNSDWLVRTVPEIGTGIGAGIPDYPWWFGVDSEYALQGYMAIGQDQAVYQTIELLDSISNATNGNGRIVHEVSTNGVVFNPGNINETPQFASLIWEIYQWNGDLAFLKKYFPTIEKGLNWLMTENDDNQNLFPDGFGMMEIHGLDSEMIDVAAYTQKAFGDAAKMAEELGRGSLATAYQNTAATLKDKINEKFWSEQFESYADFIGTDEQALRLIEDAIIRADTLNKPWAVAELKQTKAAILNNPSEEPRPFVLHHNWVVNTPMEVQIADSTRAIKALNTAEKFVNPFGVFVTGIDRDESAGADEGSFKGSKVFSYTGAVMTLPTGVQAIAENNYGRPDRALDYLKRMTRSFSFALPGSMYEVSPDYGMMTQAWNIYGFAIPIVKQFFGIRPQAAQRRILIQPQMPGEWEQASIENVTIGNNQLSIFYQKEGKSVTLKIIQTNPEWTIQVEYPLEINGQHLAVESSTTEAEIINDRLVIITQEKVKEINLKYQ